MPLPSLVVCSAPGFSVRSDEDHYEVWVWLARRETNKLLDPLGPGPLVGACMALRRAGSELGRQGLIIWGRVGLGVWGGRWEKARVLEIPRTIESCKPFRFIRTGREKGAVSLAWIRPGLCVLGRSNAPPTSTEDDASF